MDILIAPITGEKELTLVHRDDLQKLYDLKVGNGHAVVFFLFFTFRAFRSISTRQIWTLTRSWRLLESGDTF